MSGKILKPFISGEEINLNKVAISTLVGGATAALGPWAGAAVSGGADVLGSLIDGERDIKKLLLTGAISATSSLAGSGAEKITRKIATSALKKTSTSNIKKVVTKIADVRGKTRNKIKNPANWEKGLTRQIEQNIINKSLSVVIGSTVSCGVDLRLRFLS